MVDDVVVENFAERKLCKGDKLMVKIPRCKF